MRVIKKLTSPRLPHRRGRSNGQPQNGNVVVPIRIMHRHRERAERRPAVDAVREVVQHRRTGNADRLERKGLVERLGNAAAFGWRPIAGFVGKRDGLGRNRDHGQIEQPQRSRRRAPRSDTPRDRAIGS